jgi:hypothetical protein
MTFYPGFVLLVLGVYCAIWATSHRGWSSAGFAAAAGLFLCAFCIWAKN